MTECLFCKQHLTTIRVPDKDDRKSYVCVTIENQTTTSPITRKTRGNNIRDYTRASFQSLFQELVIRLTDENDLFFLYSLHLTEEDFQHLKIDQGLLVDFAAFPQRFIDLLESCLAEENRSNPRYILQFVGTDERNHKCWFLNIIETNPFKHLTHLSLKFVPGTDRDIKDYLAQCLKRVTAEKKALTAQLNTTEASLSRQLKETESTLQQRTSELDRLKAEWKTRTDELSNKFSQQLTLEKERILEVQEQQQLRIEKEKREIQAAHLEIVKPLESRARELEASSKCLSEENYRLEAQLREARSKLEIIESDYQESKRTVQGLRRELEAQDKSSHERECLVHRLETRVAVLEQEKLDREAMLAKSQELTQAEAEQRALLQEEGGRRARQIEKLERSVKTLTDELGKGNEIIKKLQAEVRSYHAKVKLRTQIAAEQERVISEKDAEIGKVREALKEAKELLRHKEEEVGKLQEQLETTREKLNEAKQLLKTNENVIQWLNKQITENQLQKHRKFDQPPLIASNYRPPNPAISQSVSSMPRSLGPQPSAASTLTQMATKYSNLPPPVNKSTPMHAASGSSLAGSLEDRVNRASPVVSGALGLDTKYLQRTDLAPGGRHAYIHTPPILSSAATDPAPTSAYFPGAPVTDLATS